MDVPNGPELGFKLVMAGVTRKLTELLARPPTVTTTAEEPAAAPFGTEITTLVPFQLAGASAAPPKVTVLVPCEVPKFAPEIVIDVLQLVGVAVVPLKVTVLVPCVAPKFAPAIITDVPTGPDVGFRLVMLGAGVVTAKFTVLLATPPTVTTTPPEVAPTGTGTVMLVVPQFVGAAFVPLNLTVLVPWVAPKFAPRIVTEVPTGPDVGFREAMLGTVPPPLPAARKATICMIHDWILSRTAVAL